ncbi:HflK protein [Spirochaeta thermophila DSM 6578]|uniref:Protein HflK n=1 Tax=Winmispira thermophila (strain ATCC 700085 / DSM 6578 / Z-1203) TaxID=869211 RepID=G0GBE2_WINT7|nr:FtsH protease activity modulator HflK [Spirochaeta thermophila]AEJ61951.1 HflK protein [Spirochaeta thermophila DSM 6578]
MYERDVTPKPVPFYLKPRILLLVVLVVVGLILFFTSFFVVDQTEEAVVLRFGRYHRTVGPGLHWKLPLGIDRNYNVPTQVIQNMSFGFRTERPGVVTVYSSRDYPGESIMLTGDLNIVDVEWIIQYRIVDPKAWLFNVEDRTKTIRDISQSVINMLVGDRAILNVISVDRTMIESEGQELMNQLFKQYDLGITVTAVKLQNVVPPKGEVQDAFEDVNKAIQDMNRLINEGKEAYNKEIPRVKGEAQRIIQEAEGYRAERINRAEGEAKRFLSVLEEYRKAPEITRTRLYYEMLEKVLQNAESLDLVDKTLENFLPLKALGGTGTTGGAR